MPVPQVNWEVPLPAETIKQWEERAQTLLISKNVDPAAREQAERVLALASNLKEKTNG